MPSLLLRSSLDSDLKTLLVASRDPLWALQIQVRNPHLCCVKTAGSKPTHEKIPLYS